MNTEPKLRLGTFISNNAVRSKVKVRAFKEEVGKPSFFSPFLEFNGIFNIGDAHKM